MVMLEALASGVPVLGTPVGAIPEVGSFCPELVLAGPSAPDIVTGIHHYLSSALASRLTSERCREYALGQYRCAQKAQDIADLALGRERETLGAHER